MNRGNIIILHGWGMESARYGKLITLMKSKGYKVFCPDLPGFGHNKTLQKPYNLKDYLDFLNKYISSNKLNDYILIGHSFGGRMAIKLAVQNPKGLSRIILTGTPGFVPVNKFKITIFWIISKMGKLVFLLMPFEKGRYFARKALYWLSGSTDYLKTEGYLKETFKSIIREDLKIPMENMVLPVLLIWGEKDTIVPVNVAYKMHKTIKSSQLVVIPGAGHKLPCEQPEVFFDALNDLK